MKKANVAIALIAPISLVAMPSFAQSAAQVEARYSDYYGSCIESSKGIIWELDNCVDLELGEQDKRLNQTYKTKMASLSTKQKTVLRNSQRRWIKSRDAKCQAAYRAAGGGQNSDSQRLGCLLSETVKRTIWLEDYKPGQ